ncbi:hypothetical protein DRN69_09395 [Candidatus Pacearchaeota archaeon]|nr:MAG: hypothetical protein DRN69_09395 [Candidatus Pacearchaeota archaeon]
MVYTNLTVKYKDYPSFNNFTKTQKLVQQVGDGSIIKRFDKTPIPKKQNDVICPHFLELKWAYGCPFNCSWCYLKGTFRFLPTKTAPHIKPMKKVEEHLLALFNETTNNGYPKEVLNTGEIADSLMFENNGNSFSKFIIPIFDSQKKHKVLFLSKSDRVNNLLNLKINGSPIMSFTLNASYVSGKWEKKAPPVRRRISAARQLCEVGYPVRIRIDPIIPIRNWEIHYKELIDNIFSNFEPERITLGSLRGLQSTINNATDKSWVKYLSETSNWGKKIDFNLRFKMYKTIIDYLKDTYNYKHVAMCKETIAMWNKLKMNWRKIKCNCIL